MKSLILNAVLTLIRRLDDAGLFDVLRSIMLQKLHPWLVARLEHLVRLAETNDWPGDDKARWVLEQVKSPDSPVMHYALSVPGWLLNLGIEAAVARMKTLEPKEG